MDDDMFHEAYLKDFSMDGYVHIIKLDNYSFSRVNNAIVLLQKINFKIINVSMTAIGDDMYTFAIAYQYIPE